MSWEVLILNAKDNITKGVVLAQVVHGGKDGLGMAVRENLSIHGVTHRIWKFKRALVKQRAAKLNFFGTRPNWAVFYIAYTKFHLPRPVFHSPGQICSRIGER